MRCLISKIIIDYCEEPGKTLPGIVRTHLKTCSDCSTYINLGKQLQESDSDTSISNTSIRELNNKIISNSRNQSEEKIIKMKDRIFPSIPAVAALFIIILSLGIILFQTPKKSSEITGSNYMINIGSAKNLKNLSNLFSHVESPMVKEAEELKRTINSAKKYLSSVMDFGIPGIPD